MHGCLWSEKSCIGDFFLSLRGLYAKVIVIFLKLLLVCCCCVIRSEMFKGDFGILGKLCFLDSLTFQPESQSCVFCKHFVYLWVLKTYGSCFADFWDSRLSPCFFRNFLFSSRSCTGAAGWGARQRASVCHKSAEERRSLPGRGHGERSSREEGSGAPFSSSLPHVPLLRLPDWGVWVSGFPNDLSKFH